MEVRRKLEKFCQTRGSKQEKLYTETELFKRPTAKKCHRNKVEMAFVPFIQNNPTTQNKAI